MKKPKYLTMLITFLLIITVFSIHLFYFIYNECCNKRLINAIFRNDINAVNNELSSGADPNTRCNLSYNNYQCINFLFACYKINLSKSQEKPTALILAAQEGNPDIVKLLIDHGADINAKTSCCGQTALQCAEMMSDILPHKGHPEDVIVIIRNKIQHNNGAF
ncbi:MAG TPA: ankyrin repeat domain-containing protein [Chthonomonadaceae bacterium]|nr:ankyrin repeat domain-containing protein [Chthonomonadaceae bacterium]